MRSIIFVVSILVAYFSLAINAFSPNEPSLLKERSFDSYDLALMEADPYYEKLHAFRNSLASVPSSSGELNPSFDGTRPKRGRQCLWKICSWSLEKSKKKAAPSVLVLEN